MHTEKCIHVHRNQYHNDSMTAMNLRWIPKIHRLTLPFTTQVAVAPGMLKLRKQNFFLPKFLWLRGPASAAHSQSPASLHKPGGHRAHGGRAVDSCITCGAAWPQVLISTNYRLLLSTGVGDTGFCRENFPLRLLLIFTFAPLL